MLAAREAFVPTTVRELHPIALLVSVSCSGLRGERVRKSDVDEVAGGELVLTAEPLSDSTMNGVGVLEDGLVTHLTCFSPSMMGYTTRRLNSR